MTTLDDFIESPLSKNTLHKKYAKSFIHLSPMPEVTTGEVLLASLYRNVGFTSSVKEKQVPKNNRLFSKSLQKKKRPSGLCSPVDIDIDLWDKIVTRSITSPKLINQSKKKFLQLSPLVPDATIYSMSPRLVGNPWNPGKLIAKIIDLGTTSTTESIALWQRIYNNLSVTDDDDIWARLIQKELESWREKELLDSWGMPEDLPLSVEEKTTNLFLDSPASYFVKDLNAVLDLKNSLTRRQWISMLESLCRIGASAHVMWLCNVNKTCIEMFQKALSEGGTFSEQEVQKELALIECFWRLDHPTTKTIEEVVRSYMLGRCSMNLIIWMLVENGGFNEDKIDLLSPEGISNTLNYLSENRDKFDYKDYHNKLRMIFEADPTIMACKKGTSKNISEFLNYVIRQRQTSESGFESYDQGYYIRKRGAYSSAPWVAGLGPTSILLMVYCTVSSSNGPCTIADLILQLSHYGLEADMQQNSNSVFYKLLRNLGLVIDSPDAEGGMIITSHFKL
jgi:hypothetical protein